MKHIAKIFQYILTGFYAVFLALLFVFPIVLIPVAWLFERIFKSRKIISMITTMWGKLAVWGTLSRVRTYGRENLPRGEENVVYVVNHQGFFDIPLVLGWIDGRIRFIARENLFSVPVLGLWMKFIGCIPISRKASRDELRRFEGISNVLSSGAVLAIFPEGTRSFDGTFGKFHTSAFRPARIAKSTIVPVLLWGSHKILPRGGKIIRPTGVKICIDEPIRFEKYSETSPKELADIILKKFQIMKERISS